MNIRGPQDKGGPCGEKVKAARIRQTNTGTGRHRYTGKRRKTVMYVEERSIPATCPGAKPRTERENRYLLRE
jgi:hypothetical protein